VFLLDLLAGTLPMCPAYGHLGMHLWTAGQRLHDGWKWRLGVHSHDMPYTNWDDGQPDWSHENCIKLWPGEDYRWNNYDCSFELCFICENRSADMNAAGGCGDCL